MQKMRQPVNRNIHANHIELISCYDNIIGLQNFVDINTIQSAYVCF